MKKLRSNSKEVREAIKLHLIEISQNDDAEVETVEQAKKYIVNRFYNEKIKNNQYNSISYQVAFADWLNGLSLNTYYMTNDVINYLHGIGLYGKDEEQERKRSVDLYHYLIFKEIQKELHEFLEGVK